MCHNVLLRSIFRRPFSASCGSLLDASSVRSDKSLVLYDTRTRSKRPLITQIPGVIKWYMCGPTVYADSHVGHAATYVRFDVIRRLLSGLFDYNVLLAMCVTDIDDKIIASAAKQNISHTSVARKYEDEFFLDMDRLGVARPSLVLRVTEHIPHVVAYIQKAIDNNIAYVVDDGSVYFDVTAYGKKYDIFTKLQTAVPEAVPVPGKRSPADFALWKSAKVGEPSWSVTWSDGSKSSGRPGWHIECSTLSTIAFGNRLDIHSGGEDLMFPHHQNEVAQCVAAGCISEPESWVGHWMHSGHLHMPSTGSDAKMSKSLGNTITVSDLLSGSKVFQDVDAVSSSEFRLFVCLSHYRDRIALTPQSLNEAKNLWRKIEEFAAFMRAWATDQLSPSSDTMLSEAEFQNQLQTFRQRVISKICDDIDTPAALKELEALIGDTNRKIKLSKCEAPTPDFSISRLVPLSFLDTLSWFSSIIGLRNPDPAALLVQHDPKQLVGANDSKFARAISIAVDFRTAVRTKTLGEMKTSSAPQGKNAAKDLMKYCDDFRSNLADLGFVIKDTGAGRATWKLQK